MDFDLPARVGVEWQRLQRLGPLGSDQRVFGARNFPWKWWQTWRGLVQFDNNLPDRDDWRLETGVIGAFFFKIVDVIFYFILFYFIRLRNPNLRERVNAVTPVTTPYLLQHTQLVENWTPDLECVWFNQKTIHTFFESHTTFIDYSSDSNDKKIITNQLKEYETIIWSSIQDVIWIVQTLPFFPQVYI